LEGNAIGDYPLSGVPPVDSSLACRVEVTESNKTNLIYDRKKYLGVNVLKVFFIITKAVAK